MTKEVYIPDFHHALSTLIIHNVAIISVFCMYVEASLNELIYYSVQGNVTLVPCSRIFYSSLKLSSCHRDSIRPSKNLLLIYLCDCDID